MLPYTNLNLDCLNVLTTVSSQGLRGSIKTHRDHFSNDDLTINSPISLELLSFTEEAQLEERLEEDAESVPQEDLKAESMSYRRGYCCCRTGGSRENVRGRG